MFFKDTRADLELCAVDDKKCVENPFLLKLKEIIFETHREENNMKGIVFVRTREVADFIASWMGETEELIHIKARKYTEAQTHLAEDGKVKESSSVK